MFSSAYNGHVSVCAVNITYIALVIRTSNLGLNLLTQVLDITAKSCVFLNDSDKVTGGRHQGLVSHIVDPHVCQSRLQAVAALLANAVVFHKSRSK